MTYTYTPQVWEWRSQLKMDGFVTVTVRQILEAYCYCSVLCDIYSSNLLNIWTVFAASNEPLEVTNNCMLYCFFRAVNG